ncbi:MAG: nuclease-related domain-containing protein [Opitutaceae bacterium]|nr:nuclease-related domain-containing protein [Opitutaceae bacterium]
MRETILLTGYFIIFLFVPIGFLWARKKRRWTRKPFGDKLLRQPGESLSEQIKAGDDNAILVILLPAAIPLIIAPTLYQVLSGPLAMGVPAAVGGAIAGMIAAMITCWSFQIRWVSRFSVLNLGYLGERLVGEHLATLRADGFHVFHDLQADGGERKFNLDHVVVGPSGVWMIETKTRKKRDRAADTDAHKVKFDGTALHWPSFTETKSVDQAKHQIRWLAKWIEQRTGLRVEPKGIIAIPGWYVVSQAIQPVRVLNEKMLRSAIAAKQPPCLSVADIQAIARQLELACRDVEV